MTQPNNPASRLSISSYYVLRLPYVYCGEEGAHLPPHQPPADPLQAGFLRKGSVLCSLLVKLVPARFPIYSLTRQSRLSQKRIDLEGKKEVRNTYMEKKQSDAWNRDFDRCFDAAKSSLDALKALMTLYEALLML